MLYSKPSKPFLRFQDFPLAWIICPAHCVSIRPIRKVLESGLLGLLGLHDGFRTPKTISKPLNQGLLKHYRGLLIIRT